MAANIIVEFRDANHNAMRQTRDPLAMMVCSMVITSARRPDPVAPRSKPKSPEVRRSARACARSRGSERSGIRHEASGCVCGGERGEGEDCHVVSRLYYTSKYNF